MQTTYSITSSASASSVGGRSMPSVLAIRRLSTRLNVVGCSTGMSAGLAPLRILSTTSAARLNNADMLGPYDMKPPLSTNSFSLYKVGNYTHTAQHHCL